MPRAADLLLDCLVRHGVDRAFCVPGESFLAALDAAADRADIAFVTCRHEGGAGLMALADAKLTARPGVAFVSRGPGASNAAIALHSAQQDGDPLVLFVGQVERKDRGRGAFQEVDYERAFAGIVKLSLEITDAERLPELVRMAFETAASGTPGPVVVALPEDMLSDAVEAAPLAPRAAAPLHPAAEDVEAVARRIEAAARPLVIVGGGARPAEARRALLALSEAWGLPIAVTNKHQDVFPNAHPHFAGHLGYAASRSLMSVLERADLVVAVGTRLGDVQTQGYTFPRAPTPDQPLIHVHRDPGQLGRVHVPELGVVADAGPFLAALARAPARRVDPAWTREVGEAAAALRAYRPREAADGVDFGAVVVELERQLPDDAIVTLDSGNFVSWVHRHFAFRPTQTMLGAVSGAMGLGVPAAVAAALRHPGRVVVGCVGDGGVLMTGNELATAVRHGLKLAIFIANNRSYATIRTHQELSFPRRVSATDLVNPDFVAWARSFGADAWRVERAEDAAEAVRAALAAPGPAVVEVRSSLELVSANTSISALRAR
jgi:acetolactate synthase-1/2/3 large subunit